MIDCNRYIHKKLSALSRVFWTLVPLVLVLLVASRISLIQLPGLWSIINF